jgi:hypothetical protein
MIITRKEWIDESVIDPSRVKLINSIAKIIAIRILGLSTVYCAKYTSLLDLAVKHHVVLGTTLTLVGAYKLINKPTWKKVAKTIPLGFSIIYSPFCLKKIEEITHKLPLSYPFLLGAAALLLIPALFQLKNNFRIPHRFNVLETGSLHPKELEVAKFLGPKALKVNQEDPRPKLLYFCAEDDHNGGFTITSAVQFNLKKLNKHYDIQFKVIKSAEDITNSIHQASEKGKIKGIWINAHGFSKGLYISKVTTSQMKVLEYKRIDKNTKWDLSAFEKLPPDARIVISACNAGEGDDSIAAHLAKVSKCVVIASKGKTASSDIRIEKAIPLEVSLSYPSELFTRAATREFFPDGSARFYSPQEPTPKRLLRRFKYLF